MNWNSLESKRVWAISFLNTVQLNHANSKFSKMESLDVLDMFNMTSKMQQRKPLKILIAACKMAKKLRCNNTLRKRIDKNKVRNLQTYSSRTFQPMKIITTSYMICMNQIIIQKNFWVFLSDMEGHLDLSSTNIYDHILVRTRYWTLSEQTIQISKHLEITWNFQIIRR